MKLPITKTFAVVCALLAVAAGAGCNKKRTNNFFSDNDFLDGTTARDTIDLNIGQNAYPSSLGFVGGSSSSITTRPFYPVGPSGEVNAFFEHHLTEVFSSNFEDFGPLNYNRVLGDSIASSAQELGDHNTFAYGINGGNRYTARAQSYNKRYVALLDSNQGGQDQSSTTLAVLDTSTGATSRSVEIIANDDQFQGGFSLQEIFVDNAGLATVLFTATEAAGVTNNATGTNVWAVQVNAQGQLARAASIVSKPFTSNTAAGNSLDYLGARQAINGDIVFVYSHTDGAGNTTLEASRYDRSTDTFGAAARVDNGLNSAFGNVRLGTDGRSFQLAFAQQVSSTASHLGVYTSRFVAQTGAGFGAPQRIDLADGSTRFVTSDTPGENAINFGRDSTSIVHFGESRSGQFRFAASWSDETVTPTALNTVTLTDDLTAGFDEDSTPQYAFQDDGSAVIFRVVNGTTGNDQIQVNTLDTSVASPRITTVSAAANVPGIETVSSGTLAIDGVEASGFSAGDNPTCVLAWTSSQLGFPPTTGFRLSAALVTDLTVQTRTQLSLESVTRAAIREATIASLNEVRTLSSYDRQYDSLIDPQSSPAAGNGGVWIAWRQYVPEQSDTIRRDRVHVWNFNPAVSTTTLSGASTVTKLGPVGDTEGLEGVYPSTDGSAVVIHRHNGAPFRTVLGPAGSLTSGATAGAATITIPEDMVLENNSLLTFTLFSNRFFGFHFDGFGYSYDTADDGANINASLHGGRLWSLFSGSDLLSSRVFAIRSR